jgi:UDP-N-acetylglucosamine--N-acetylmuramyl-(pentapeptide) pyrophosphoryl-undecaprenol N-acetylglucosamine transferase
MHNHGQKKRILFTGGGTAGHVTPNIALIEALQHEPVEMFYIGSKGGIEERLIAPSGIPFYGIQTGKFRRYLTWKHFVEPFKVLAGLWDSWKLLGQIKPDLVFSKGGFVAFPVVFMAWLKGIPVVAHESDMSPGLANRLSMPFIQKICVNFPPVAEMFGDKHRAFITGTPVRQFLLEGDKIRAMQLTKFSPARVTILVIGGSLGARKINQVVRELLPRLLERYQVIHLCGKGNVDEQRIGTPYYYQLEFANEELGDLFAMSDVVISRAGANAVYELLTLVKPHILIPLSKEASRGDQIDNANYFKAQDVSLVLEEHELTPETLWDRLDFAIKHKKDLKEKIEALGFQSATDKVKSVIYSILQIETSVEVVHND